MSKIKIKQNIYVVSNVEGAWNGYNFFIPMKAFPTEEEAIKYAEESNFREYEIDMIIYEHQTKSNTRSILSGPSIVKKFTTKKHKKT